MAKRTNYFADLHKKVVNVQEIIEAYTGCQWNPRKVKFDGPSDGWYSFYLWTPKGIVFRHVYNNRQHLLNVAHIFKDIFQEKAEIDINEYRAMHTGHWNTPTPFDPAHVFAFYKGITETYDRSFNGEDDEDEEEPDINIYQPIINRFANGNNDVRLYDVPRPDIYWHHTVQPIIHHWNEFI